MHGNVYWFSLLGQALGFVGALIALANPLRESRNARVGLGLIALGFLFQAIATIISK